MSGGGAAPAHEVWCAFVLQGKGCHPLHIVEDSSSKQLVGQAAMVQCHPLCLQGELLSTCNCAGCPRCAQRGRGFCLIVPSPSDSTRLHGQPGTPLCLPPQVCSKPWKPWHPHTLSHARTRTRKSQARALRATRTRMRMWHPAAWLPGTAPGGVGRTRCCKW